MADDDSSELSSLSSLSLSPVPSDDESDVQLKPEGILKFFKGTKMPARDMSPPATKRQPSPPHEYILADKQDIAVSSSSFCRVKLTRRRERSRVVWRGLEADHLSSSS